MENKKGRHPVKDAERKYIAHKCKHFICWQYWGRDNQNKKGRHPVKDADRAITESDTR